MLARTRQARASRASVDDLIDASVKMYADAKKRKWIPEKAPDPDPGKCAVNSVQVILRDSNGKQLRVYSVRSVRDFIGHQQRQQGSLSTGTSRIDSQRMALDWARSMGYPMPNPPNGCLNSVAIGCGFLLAILPGILMAMWASNEVSKYHKAIDDIIARWIDAGCPPPGIKTMSPVVDPQQALAPPPMDIAQVELKILQLATMKEKGVISDEEYQALRRKELGL